ncbi:MAG: DUF7343 domain-containing protein [Candidatus Freyarchaeota archaeon]
MMFRGVIGTKSLMWIILLLVLLSPSMDVKNALAVVEDDYSPESLFLTVYADGRVDVEYHVLVDPLLASVNVRLPGIFYENLLVINEEGLPLDFSILDGEVLVYSLGSWRVKFYYVTADLTSKVGRVWILHINSSIAFTVRLPADATVVSLSEAPTSIWTVEGHYFLTMPAGEQEISYILGAIGSKESAASLINEAEQVIKEAKAKGADVTQAESKLNEARTALEEGRYAEAELLASEAKKLAEEALLKTVTQPLNPYWTVTALVAAGLAVAFVFFQLRKKAPPKVERESRQIDVHKILEGKEHLRLEDREAIEFIASAGGEVFEAELREHFKLPKSTVWRMVRRLKREGLVEVEKVGGQNLIHLIKNNLNK